MTQTSKSDLQNKRATPLSGYGSWLCGANIAFYCQLRNNTYNSTLDYGQFAALKHVKIAAVPFAAEDIIANFAVVNNE